MKIALDCRMLMSEKRGIYRYTKRLYQELLKINPDIFYSYPSYFKDDELKQLKSLDFDIEIPPSNDIRQQKYVQFLAEMTDVDIVYSPFHTLPKFLSCQSVATIHDVIPLVMQETSSPNVVREFKTYYYDHAHNVDMIIADSEASKQDIVKFFNVDPLKIKVIHLGIDDKLSTSQSTLSSTDVLNRYTLCKNQYLLYVGGVEPRKNIKCLLEAFSLIKPQYPDLKIVIAGILAHGYEDTLSAIQEHPYTADITYLGYVSDEELQHLYINALAFVFPSFYEGFGLPVLEAMKFGVPVVCSSTSSMPEVGGDTILYFDPYDANSLVRTIVELVEDANGIQIMVEMAKQRAAEFTWEKTAKQVMNVFKELHSSQKLKFT